MSAATPVELVTSRLEGVRQSGSGWKARCPLQHSNGDAERSLSISAGDDGRALLNCFTGHTTADIVAAIGLEMKDLFKKSELRSRKTTTVAPITLDELAADKGLPVEALARFGLKNATRGGVDIPYHDLKGQVVQTKGRSALSAKRGSWWPAGKPLMAYGLNRLKDAQTAGYIILGEGESDGWTAWFHEFPYLGVPGANAAKVLLAEHLEGINRTYIVQETDKAGETFISKVAARLADLGWQGNARAIRHLGAKDLNDLHKRDGQDFKASLTAALESAEPLEIRPRSADAPTEVDIELFGLTRTLAEYIQKTESFAQDAGAKLHNFDGGVYRPRGEQVVHRAVQTLLDAWDRSSSWSTKLAHEVSEYLRTAAPELWERPPTDRVNVLNGILDVGSRLLQPHTPAFLSTIQLPVRFDPTATCSAWERFVADVLPEDCPDLAWELAADLATPDRSEQRAVLALGEGANGKSTLLRGLVAFVGKRNVSTISLHKLEADRFAASRLVGKLANVCPDLPSSHLASTSVFKALTGGDVMTGERKYSDSFEFEPYCRLIFSANHPPRSDDASHAFFRRWLVVPFPNTFEGGNEESRRDLDAALSDPKELSGVLNKALTVLPRLRQHGFTESISMLKARDEFRSSTDPLAVWLDQKTIDSPGAYAVRDDLRKAYYADCMEAGRPPLSQTAFGLAFKRARPVSTEVYRTIGGVRKWCYSGIGLLERGVQGVQGVQGFSNCFVAQDQEEEIEPGEGKESYRDNNSRNPEHPEHPEQTPGPQSTAHANPQPKPCPNCGGTTAGPWARLCPACKLREAPPMVNTGGSPLPKLRRSDSGEPPRK